jgi:hypothetical protein
MDIVRITLLGHGYDVVRGIVAKKEYNKMKNSNSLDNIWIKNLNKKISRKLKGFIQEFRDYGITSGDIIVTVNDEEIINLPISVLNSYSFNDIELVELEGYHYPVTDEVVMTSVQKLEGVFMDVVFVTKEDFDFSKFKFIEKEIQDEKENIIISSLIAEVYYDGELISFTGNNTELRMSNIYYDIGGGKKLVKNEENID